MNTGVDFLFLKSTICQVISSERNSFCTLVSLVKPGFFWQLIINATLYLSNNAVQNNSFEFWQYNRHPVGTTSANYEPFSVRKGLRKNKSSKSLKGYFKICFDLVMPFEFKWGTYKNGPSCNIWGVGLEHRL